MCCRQRRLLAVREGRAPSPSCSQVPCRHPQPCPCSRCGTDTRAALMGPPGRLGAASLDSCWRGNLGTRGNPVFQHKFSPSPPCLCPRRAFLCTLSHHRAKPESERCGTGSRCHPGLDGQGGSPMRCVCEDPCGKEGPAWGPWEPQAEPQAGLTAGQREGHQAGLKKGQQEGQGSSAGRAELRAGLQAGEWAGPDHGQDCRQGSR